MSKKIPKQQTVLLIIMTLSICYGAYSLFFTNKFSATHKMKLTPLSEGIDLSFFKISKDALASVNDYTISQAEADWNEDPFLNLKLTVLKKKQKGGLTKKIILKPETKEIVKLEISVPVKEEVSNLPEPKKEEIEIPEFKYTAYLGVGTKKMAVINGMEYSEGDNLEPPDFFLKSINQKSIVIENKNNNMQIEVNFRE